MARRGHSEEFVLHKINETKICCKEFGTVEMRLRQGYGNPISPAAISGFGRFGSAFTPLYQASGLLNICPGMRLWLCAACLALAVAARRDIAICSIC